MAKPVPEPALVLNPQSDGRKILVTGNEVALHEVNEYSILIICKDSDLEGRRILMMIEAAVQEKIVPVPHGLSGQRRQAGGSEAFVISGYEPRPLAMCARLPR